MSTIIYEIGDAIRGCTETWENLTNNGSSIDDELENEFKTRFAELSRLATDDFLVSAFRAALREEITLARRNIDNEGKSRWGYFNQYLLAVIYRPASELLHHVNLWLERNDNPEKKDNNLTVKVPALEPMYGPELVSNTTVETVRHLKYLLVDFEKVRRQEFKGSPAIPTDPDGLSYARVKSPPDTLTPPSTDGLTQRQQILEYFYKGGKMLERKHKQYNDYNIYCSRNKRLSYSNGSESRLKYLTKDIEIVMLHLAGEFRQDAERELSTLKNRLFVEN